jgi:hypothetical protein
LHRRNHTIIPEDRRLEFSVDIKLGNVIEEERIYGDWITKLRESGFSQEPAMEDPHVVPRN